MIIGSHLLINSDHPEADRAFFRDVLNFHSVDAGRGWLIFALPPAEAAIHPAEPSQSPTRSKMLGCALYLMCDNIESTIADLKARNVPCSQVHEERWGSVTSVVLPSGNEIGLYQPKHPLAINHGQ